MRQAHATLAVGLVFVLAGLVGSIADAYQEGRADGYQLRDELAEKDGEARRLMEVEDQVMALRRAAKAAKPAEVTA